MLTPKVVGKFLIGRISECPISYRLYGTVPLELQGMELVSSRRSQGSRDEDSRPGTDSDG